MAAMGELDVGGIARTKSLEVVRAVDGDAVCLGKKDGHCLVAGRGNPTRFSQLLLLPATVGEKIPTTGRASVGRVGYATSPRIPRVVGRRRHANQTRRAQGPRGRHPSQSHARTQRTKVFVWTRPLCWLLLPAGNQQSQRVGDDRVGCAPSGLEDDWLALAGVVVRASQRRGPDSRQVRLEVFHQVGIGQGGLAAISLLAVTACRQSAKPDNSPSC